MADKLLPDESPDDLRLQATITPADISRAQKFVQGMKKPARYWDGDKLMPPMSASAAKAFWDASEPE